MLETRIPQTFRRFGVAQMPKDDGHVRLGKGSVYVIHLLHMREQFDMPAHACNSAGKGPGRVQVGKWHTAAVNDIDANAANACVVKLRQFVVGHRVCHCHHPAKPIGFGGYGSDQCAVVLGIDAGLDQNAACCAKGLRKVVVHRQTGFGRSIAPSGRQHVVRIGREDMEMRVAGVGRHLESRGTWGRIRPGAEGDIILGHRTLHFAPQLMLGSTPFHNHWCCALANPCGVLQV